MKALSDLIKNRMAAEDIQILRAVDTEKGEFLAAIRKVNQLPINYEEALKKALANDPLKVKDRKIKGGVAIEVTLKIQGRTCVLYIIEDEAKTIRKAQYLLYSDILKDKEYKVYIRDLLKVDLEE